MAGKSKRTFRVLRGFDFGINGAHQYEPGDLVSDLPAEFVAWMLAEGTIEEVAPAKTESKG